MGTGTKPYRRYRARSGSPSGDGRDGLEALRALNRGGGAAAPPRERERPERRPAEEVARPPRPPKPPRRTRRRLAREGRPWWSFRGLGPGGWAWRIGLILLVALLAWGTAGFLAFRSAVADANAKITKGAKQALDDPGGGITGTPENTLIIGSDARPGETRARADTIMIMRTDPKAGRIKYLSIPRDFRFDYAQVGASRLGLDRINVALRAGGQRFMIRAVKQLTGLPINHIIIIKFAGLKRVVDSLGGVTVNNPTAIVHCAYPGGTTVSFPKGRVELNGTRALEFARVRKCDDDFHRAARQQALVAALKGKVLSFWNLWRAPWRGATVVRALGTDLGVIDLIKMGWLQARLKQDPKDRYVLAGQPELIGSQAMVVPLPDQDQAQLARFESSR